MKGRAENPLPLLGPEKARTIPLEIDHYFLAAHRLLLSDVHDFLCGAPFISVHSSNVFWKPSDASWTEFCMELPSLVGRTNSVPVPSGCLGPQPLTHIQSR